MLLILFFSIYLEVQKLGDNIRFVCVCAYMENIKVHNMRVYSRARGFTLFHN